MFDKRKLQAQMVLKGITGRDLASKMGINEGTLYRKFGNDGDFTRSEIQQIMDILEIKNPDEVFDIFFATELAQNASAT